MKLINNCKDLGNLEYGKVLGCMFETLKLLKDIEVAFTSPLEEIVDVEDCEGLTEEESRCLSFNDELEKFDMMVFNQVSNRVGQGIYFNKRSNGLFLNSLELCKMHFILITDKINFGFEINFEKEHAEAINSCITDLNYCLINSFELFRVVDDGCVQLCVNEFCTKSNIDVEKLANDMIDYYKDHRPNLPLFTKYPELLSAIEDKIPGELLFRIVDLSEWIEDSEMKDIIAGALEIDENFVSELEERFREGVCIE